MLHLNDNVLGCTVHPKVKQLNSTIQTTGSITTNELVDANNEGIHIIESQNSQKVPIEIYFKPDVSKSTDLTHDVDLTDSPKVLKKALKFRLDEESSSRPFEFTIIFKLISHRQYALDRTFGTPNSGAFDIRF